MKAAGALLAGALFAGAAHSADAVTLRADREPFRGGERIDVRLPASARSYTVARGPGSTRRVLTLIPNVEKNVSRDDPCATDRSRSAELWAIGLDETGRIDTRRLRDDLDGDLLRVAAADLDGDGTDEILVSSVARVLVVPDDPAESPVILVDRGPGDGVPGMTRAPLRVLGSADPWIVSPELGDLRFHRPIDGATVWPETARIELPVRAEVRAGRIVVSLPVPGEIPPDSNGRSVLVTDPSPVGDRRLRYWRIDPATADEGARAVECWAGLPGPEYVLSAAYVRIDDVLRLLVLTTDAERLSLYSEKRLRLFPVERDRSRTGLPPVFAVETRIDLWQMASPSVLDVDGDGRDDLVLGYWKGRARDRVVLDAYRRDSEGGFRTSPDTTTLEVRDGDPGYVSFGHDLDGDGGADLILLSVNGLRVHRADPKRKDGRNLVEKKPRWLIPTGPILDDPVDAGSPGHPFRAETADLDGDGRGELIWLGDTTKQRAVRIGIVRLDDEEAKP